MIMRQKVVSILALLLMAATGATAQTTTYPVEVKPDITDADKWSATPNPAAAGETVKANYSGTLKVKSIKYVVPVTAITLNKTATEIGKGETETLSVSVLPEIATNKTVTVTWSSSAPNKASVNPTTGEVTAKELTGDTPVIITATATDGSGMTATCNVTIKAPVTTDPVINGWTEGTTIGGGQAEE